MTLSTSCCRRKKASTGIEEKVERYLSLCAHDDSPRMELPE
jgi:hypothetical protein